MNRIAALARAEFTLLGRNRFLLFNAVVLPLVFPIGMLVLGREGGLSEAAVSAGLEIFVLFVLVFVVYYNLLSVYATRRDELVLKRLRTGECRDIEILTGPAVPSWLLCVLTTVVVGLAVVILGGRAPVNPVLVAAAVMAGAVLFSALALVTSAFTRNAEAAQITCLPVLVLATAGMSTVRSVVPDNLAEVLAATPFAAVVELMNVGWFGRTTSEFAAAAGPLDTPAGFAATFGSAVPAMLVLSGWVAASILVATVYFRWEPRA